MLRQTLQPGDRYMELGAGIGLVTVCACRIVGSENVVAYEADPTLARVAKETASRNACSPSIFNAVLGETAGDTEFYVREDFGNRL